VKQEEESKDLYIIAKGICSVDLTDHKKKKRRNISVLEQGQMFGEISLIYGCPRTATVLSRNYCTMAKITPEVYQHLSQEFPAMNSIFKDQIEKYKDGSL